MEGPRNFLAALAHMAQFYNVVMTEDDFINIALHAWEHIGNKNYRCYVYESRIEDHMVELPCNVDIVEAVMRREVDHQITDGVDTWSVDLYNQNVETWIELWKRPTEFLYYEGTYINYEQQDNVLHFREHVYEHTHIIVLYKGIYADDKGLPFLNFKEVDAIAKYVAFIATQKKALMTRDQATFQMAQMLNNQWKFAVEDARTPIYLNQNDMDRVLNAQSSWDRKRYGRSYKAVK